MKHALCLILLALSFKVLALDLSAHYEQGKGESFTAEERTRLLQYKILIVPGVLAESFSVQGNNQIKVGFIFEEGFIEQIKLMDQMRLDYAFLNIDTENSPELNGRAIVQAIKDSPRPVLIYSHSKGALDTLEAFRQAPELMMGKVKGWLTIQSPFWGSSVASMMYNSTPMRHTGKTIFEWMGGEIGGMSALTLEERRTVMSTPEMSALLEQLPARVRIINYASFKANSFGIDTPLELFRNLQQGPEGNNDGVVAIHSALMHFHGHKVDYVLEPGVDHLMTMTKYRPDKFDLINVNRNKYSPRSHTVGMMRLLIKDSH